MSDQRIVVVGDLMLDRFLWGMVRRISPEAPVPVVRLQSESIALGGAGNVARNLRSLGSQVDLVGIVGRDPAGEQVRHCLQEAGLHSEGVIEARDRTTTIKSRVIAHHQQVVRIDQEATGSLAAGLVNEVIGRISSLLPGARALLVSDYDKGVISGDLLKKVLPAAFSAGLIVAIDPKPSNYDHYHPATVITPNAHEARVMAGQRESEEGGILAAGEAIRSHLGAAVLITQGEGGMTLFESDRKPLTIPAVGREVFDVTGAGDTVIATLTLALAGGASIEEGAILANVAAGCAVGKLGTAVVGPEELLSALNNLLRAT